jgi:hypothetical protein
MHSLLDIELATRLDRDRHTLRIGPSLRSLIHRLQQG